ncbi:hypothetical protein G6F70_007714 [Rhizopus microsporus]|nr:hypothetical protein G6F71_000946 [Rhizopus microsporus]KAG1196094.1 hypothetical protein G6F70_007714 [Rhizopus microsporus]KAG1215402.1 hypothetical protein G6F69_001077 [Rhizopus microsporus]
MYRATLKPFDDDLYQPTTIFTLCDLPNNEGYGCSDKSYTKLMSKLLQIIATKVVTNNTKFEMIDFDDVFIKFELIYSQKKKPETNDESDASKTLKLLMEACQRYKKEKGEQADIMEFARSYSLSPIATDASSAPTAMFDDNPSTENLCEQFENLKKAYRYPAERNAPKKIQERIMAWPKVGERAITETPKTRAKTITILGAISPFGVVDVKVSRSYETSSKKRKLPGKAQASDSQAIKTTCTVAGHYFNFVASTIDVLDQHEQFKDCYILMDNCPIHNSEDIPRYVVKRGYRYVYLPPYSPELNPIEQFWSVVKSKLKTEKLLLTETLTSRISDACNGVLYSLF